MVWLSIIFGLLTLAATLNAYFFWISNIFWLIGLAFIACSYDRRASWLWKIAAGIQTLGLLRIVYFFIIINLASIQASKTLFRYYIPDGYTGWVELEFSVKGQPPVEILNQDGVEIYKIMISPQGIGRTSTENYHSKRHQTEYFWFTDEKSWRFIDSYPNPTRIHCASGNNDRQRFYVFDKPYNSDDPEVHRICELPNSIKL